MDLSKWHIPIMALIVLVFALGHQVKFIGSDASILVGTLAGIIIGVAKERYDKNRSGFSLKDIYFDGIGIFLGIIIYVGIILL